MRLEQLAWWREEIVQGVGEEIAPGEETRRAAALIVASEALRARRLGELLPGLPACDGTPADMTSVRAYNVLLRCSPNTWTDLAERSAAELSSWPNAGRKVLAEIVEAAVEAWTRLPATRPRPTDVETTADTSAPSAQAARMRQVAAAPRRAQELIAALWSAAYRAGAQDVREAIDAAVRAPAGTALAARWAELGSLRLDVMLGVADDPAEAWDALLDADERDLRILEARRFAPAGRTTLHELGAKLGVTRERVRQIEKRTREAIAVRLATEPACAPIAHVAARLRMQWGALVPAAVVDAGLQDAVPDAADHAELRRGILLDLAGPYRLEHGFRQLGSELAHLETALDARADQPWSASELEELVSEAGVAPPHVASCLEALPLHTFEEHLLVWTGSLADKACRVLGVHGAPMSRRQLHDALGPGVNLRSLLQQVQGDERIRRMGRDSYGLAAWNGEEYTTIADELEQAIERHGGRAPLTELVDELVERFDVAPQSVRAYAGSWRFRREPGGMLVVAPAGGAPPDVARMPPELDRDLVLHRGAWTVRVTVDRELRRGSGRLTRVAIAQAAGVRPGEAHTIELQEGAVRISWLGDQPSLGSVRVLVETLACGDGDLLFVPLRDGGHAFAIGRAALDRADGLERAARELGLPPKADRAAVAAAVGLPGGASAGDLRARLQARRQVDLLPLVEDGPADGDELLDELINLGE